MTTPHLAHDHLLRPLRENGQWHRALDHAMTLLDQPGHDFHVIGETLLAAGRPRSAKRYGAELPRIKSRAEPDGGFFREISTSFAGKRKTLSWQPRRLSPDTLLAVCRAQEALGRLDEIAHRSPTASGWGLAVRLREARQLAHLAGVHASLRETWQTHLPGNMPRIATEPVLNAHLDAVLNGHTQQKTNPSEIGGPHVVSATLWHLGMLGAQTHAAFSGLPALLVGVGALRDTWLPLVNAITTHPDDYLTVLRATLETGSAEPMVAHFAHSVIDACREEAILIDRLTTLRTQLFTAVAPGRLGRILQIAVSLATAPVLNNLRIVQQYGITPKAATGITTTLVEQGLLVPHPRCTRSAVFCNPQALYLHSGLPTNPA